MDLTPSFGHQELLETLSQSSGGSRGSQRSRGERRLMNGTTPTASQQRQARLHEYSSVHSGLHLNSNVDEAYRRLGHRLSRQAHGDDWSAASTLAPVKIALQRSPRSGFAAFESQSALRPDLVPAHEMEDPQFRTQKLAKTDYTDHGDHGRLITGHNTDDRVVIDQQRNRTPMNLLKTLTYHAKDRFARWQQAEPPHDKNAFRGLSPQFALAQLDLDATVEGRRPPPATQDADVWQQQQRHHRSRNGLAAPPSKGLLSAVLEKESDTSTNSAGGMGAHMHNSPSNSLGTKESSITNETSSHQSSKPASMTRGKCLTVPDEGVANDGLDNIEGNLIVYENDAIVVPKKSVHSVQDIGNAKSDAKQGSRSAEYRIHSLLGQGTFAQVFKCLHVQTGKFVAVKVVKNKPAYTRQAAIEIDVFRALQEENETVASTPNGTSPAPKASRCDYMVNLTCFFMHRSHLCLVFELLGLNLYEVLKRRQFRGLPLSVVRSIVHQAIEGARDLSTKSIVHCDLKPEIVLLVSDEVVRDIVGAGESRRTAAPNAPATPETEGASACSSGTEQTSNRLGTPSLPKMEGQERMIKLIDFGSACFEGYTAHTYIQSRFYRSPEVLIGLPYDSAIDMWSLGCVAAELFLGLPILPGVHEHDQLGRISQMIGKIPDWMLDQGSKSLKYYVKFVSRPAATATDGALRQSPSRTPSPATGNNSVSPAPALPQWRLKTQPEYISSLSANEIRKKGGLAKLEKQPGNRYFKRNRLADILLLHAQSTSSEDKELLPAFIHFLYGLLDPDPWKRWTAFQAMQHPFLTGQLNQLRGKTPDMKPDPKEENHANLELDVVWHSPWDPAICRRKLLNVQKLREKQQAMRRSLSARPSSQPNGMGDLAMHADRRRSRRDTTSPSVGLKVPTPMPESPMSTNGYPGRAGMSPPNEISSSASSVASSTQGLFRRHNELLQGRVPAHNGTSSSLTSLGNPGVRSQLVIGDGEVHAARRSEQVLSASQGPKSYSGSVGESRRAPVDGDFAYALQRPGVVPSAGTTTAASSPGGAMLTSHQPITPTRQAVGPPHVPHLAQMQTVQVQQVPSFQERTHGSGVRSMSVSTTASNQQRNVLSPHSSHPSVSQGQSLPPWPAQSTLHVETMHQPMYPTSTSHTSGSHFTGVPSSAASSVTMPEVVIPGPVYGDPQQSFIAQQPQMHVYQQQHVAQHQFVMPPQALQFQQPGPQQQQFQPLPIQQQVYLAGAPGGGYYYVTTSASGQPIILQPVGVLNQQGPYGVQQHLQPQDAPMQVMQGYPNNNNVPLYGGGPAFAYQQHQQQRPGQYQMPAPAVMPAPRRKSNNNHSFRRSGTSM